MIAAEMKARLVADAKAHQAADRYVQGVYLDGSCAEWHGCAVGCTTAPLLAAEQGVIDIAKTGPGGSESWHEAQERLTGIPEWLGRLEDAIFEGLPIEAAREWPVRFLSALPVNVDLTPACEEWLRDIVFDPERGAMAHAAAALDWTALEDHAAALRTLNRDAEWAAAEDAARAAARAAASAAARDAASAAARAAAWAAEDAAWAAAWYAASAAAWAARDADAARAAAWEWMADRLIARLEEVSR